MLSDRSVPVENGWLASGSGFIGAAWFAPVAAVPATTAVLIVPGIAHEERTMADGLSALARSLAAAGLGALLIDLHGTAQASGQLDAPRIGERWREDIKAALRHLREAGFDRVIVVGVRLGALIALEAMRDEPVAGWVAWSPVSSGRRYVRELKMLQGASAAPGAGGTDVLSIAGHSIPASVLAHLATLELGALAACAPARVLLLDRADQLDAAWTGAFEAAGRPVDRERAFEVDRWLFRPDDLPILPDRDIARLVAWARAMPPHAQRRTAPEAPRLRLLQEVVLDAGGRRARERIVRIEPAGLCGVWTEPVDLPSEGAVRLLATLVGPGRMFPELARAEAGRGKCSLRFDFAGFSSSLRRPDDSGRAFYSLRNRHDVAAAIACVRQAGHTKVAMVGFCAGAWSMIHAGATGDGVDVVGMVGINVALYRQPDYEGLEYLRHGVQWMSKLLSLMRRFEAAVRTVDRLERRSGLALPPSRWLRRFCNSPASLLLLYGDADPGLIHLERQLGPLLGALERGGRLRVQRYRGLGHLTEGVDARAQVFVDIAAFLDTLDAAPASVGRPSEVVGGGTPAAGSGGMAGSPGLSRQGQEKIARSC